jgi:hypothetical protein
MNQWCSRLVRHCGVARRLWRRNWWLWVIHGSTGGNGASEEWNGSTLGHLVDDLRILLASNHTDRFVKNPRVCNSAIHELARFGMVNNRT